MKKLLFLSLFFLLFAGASFAQSSSSYTGRATAELNDCLLEARKNYNVNSTVVVDETSCLNNTTVYFYGTPRCAPGMLCIQVIYPVGHVTFNCHGEVVAVSCENTTF